MPRIVATALMLGLLLAAPAYAARTVEDSSAGQPITFDINALPPVCRSTLVLPVTNFVMWMRTAPPSVFQGINPEHLYRVVTLGVEPAVDACLREIHQRLEQLRGGP